MTEMTLEQAYEITTKMNFENMRNPTHLQRKAKWLIYKEVILKKYGSPENVPPHLEPDYMEGWS
jgi:hypothetical protein